jgi:hypothetical protein
MSGQLPKWPVRQNTVSILYARIAAGLFTIIQRTSINYKTIVIASEARQSPNANQTHRDCFVTLFLAMTILATHP